MRARFAALALVLPLLSSCVVGGDKDARDQTPPAPQSTAAHPTSTPSPLPPPVVATGRVHFRTTDANVGCDLEATYVLCNIVHRSFTPPKKPSDCFYTWGKAIEMAVGSKGSFFCGHGENYANSKRVLRTGQAIRVGFVTCRAVAGGVLCSGQGHGFRLTRTAYQLF